MTTRPHETHKLVYRCLLCGGTARHVAGTAIHLNENARYSDYDHNAVISRGSIAAAEGLEALEDGGTE